MPLLLFILLGGAVMIALAVRLARRNANGHGLGYSGPSDTSGGYMPGVTDAGDSHRYSGHHGHGHGHNHDSGSDSGSNSDSGGGDSGGSDDGGSGSD